MELRRALRMRDREVVAFVGGGGKTTAMFRLADELVAGGRRVVTTTTTRIFAAQIALAPQHIIHARGQTTRQLVDLLTQQLAHHPHILVVGEPDHDAGKALGVSPDTIEAMAAMPEVDVVLNEADGSRMRPFKAPADHEPVVPACSTLLVPVVGIDTLGRPLTDEFVHRAGRVAQLADIQVGVAVTPEIVASVLAHPQGGLKACPPGARVVPLINKAESAAQQVAARDLAERLLASQEIDAVAVGAVGRDDPVALVCGRVAAVVLAAGSARRFGSPKQLLPWAEDTLLGHATDVALASGARPVVVVLGYQAHACQAALGDRPVEVVINPDWAQGQSTSVRAGLAALPASVSAALFPLADQPGVSSRVIKALIERHQATLAPVIWPEYQGQRGNPVLFDRVTFPQLMRLTGDTGGRAVLHAYAVYAERLPVPEPGVLLDIDTPEDYAGAAEEHTD